MSENFDEDRLRSLLAGAASDLPRGDTLNTIRTSVAARRRMHQVLGTVAAVAVVGAGVGTGFALRHHSSANSPQPFASAPAAPSDSPSPAVSALPIAPRQLPSGTDPVAVAAKGDDWLVLTSKALLVSADQGRHWTSKALPAGYTGNTGDSGDAVGFAAYSATGGVLWQGANIWTTNDAGDHWAPVTADSQGGQVSDFAATTDHVFLLVDGPCATSFPEQCSATVRGFSAGAPSATSLALPKGGQGRSIAAVDNDVWVLSLDGSGAAGSLLTSTDGAASFTPQPFEQGCLTGQLSAAPAVGVLWGWCATGMMGHPILSTDGGKTFRDVRTPDGVANSSQVLAISVSGAMVTSDQGVQVSTNQGADWTRYPGQSSDLSGPVRLSSTDNGQQFAIATSQSGPNTLWWTEDGGQHWTRL